jgi:hypothetical protein
MKNLPFFISQLLFTAAVSLLILITKLFTADKYIHSSIWVIVIFFTLVNLLLYYMSISTASKSNGAFINAVFGAIGIKLFLCIVFIIIFLINDRSDTVWFTINFLVLYLFFTAFEIYSLLYNLRALRK